jgi:rhombotail lipoprotein
VPSEAPSYAPHTITEEQKLALAERIAGEFRGLEFVEHIELIPSAYLSMGGGFTNLDQIQAMYGVDVMALISYDQVQHTDEDWLSLSYWSIVGMYVIEGE